MCGARFFGWKLIRLMELSSADICFTIRRPIEDAHKIDTFFDDLAHWPRYLYLLKRRLDRISDDSRVLNAA